MAKNFQKPLFLANILFFILFLIYNLISKGNNYWFLSWNIFLALLPNLFSFLSRQNAKFKWLNIGLWLLFFPNSIYLLTDIIHLRASNSKFSYWYDVSLFALLFAIGIISSFVSLKSILKAHFPKFVGNRYFWLSTLLWFATFIGVYIGRDVRVNSWDIFNPQKLILSIIYFEHQAKNTIPLLFIWPTLTTISYNYWIQNQTNTLDKK
jgi:uncharacterized membrane protein